VTPAETSRNTPSPLRERAAQKINDQKHVLIVDDDHELVSLLRRFLENEGFVVHAQFDHSSGLEAALSGSYDMIVLDVMLPGGSGFELLKALRAHSRVPVVLLTARGEPVDRILGLEIGADDYVPKPCTPRELTARIRAILRRIDVSTIDDSSSAPLVVGQLTVKPQQRRAEWAGTPLNLTSIEFNILELLARNAGRPVSKRDLSELGLGRPLARYDRSIDVHMSNIRQKLGLLTDGRSCIETVYRLGYQLIKEQ
jgi:two-component system OmpR family response regulator